MVLIRVGRIYRTWLWLVFVLAGCGSDAPAPAPAITVSRAQKKPRLEITVLATAHEGRQLGSAADGSGGAARMLGYWRAREATCVSGESCYTLSLSAGDHWQVGAQAAAEAVARTMHQLGYAASALGTSDLALGPSALRRNIELAGVPHLGVQPGMQLSPSLLVDKQGVKLEIIGLSKQLSNAAMLAELTGWAHRIQAHGAHVGIVLSDACVEDLAEVFERSGRDWAFLVLAIGQRCAAAEVRSPIHSVALLAAGDGFQQYARAKLTFDQNTGALLRAETSHVEVRGGPNAPAEDPALAAKLGEWSQQP